MNFFAHEARSRRDTVRYVALFAVATFAVVAAADFVIVGSVYLYSSYFGVFSYLKLHPGFSEWLDGHRALLIWTTVLTGGLITLCSLMWIVQLARGGGAVARGLGGTLVDLATRDPRRRQLLNLVEELAIAAGTPVPDVYVLDDEPHINAFAAGYTTSDAAIAVSRGALTYLTRDELQGLLAHEFSHILNGDMRLNTRLVGILHGLMVISDTGRAIVRMSKAAADQRAILLAMGVIFGYALLVVGFLGDTLAGAIQAAVSRSREALADACAVRFTRQAAGLAGALKKIARHGAQLFTPNAASISHMLVADEVRGWGRWFSAHPPLLERIHRLDPAFTPERLESISLAPIAVPVATEPRSVPTAQRAGLSPEIVVAAIGQFDEALLAVAASRRAGIPEALSLAACDPAGAVLLVLGSVLSRQAAERAWAKRRIEPARGKLGLPLDTATRVEHLANVIAAIDPIYRLPLIAMTFPALRRRSAAELRALSALVDELAQADDTVTVFEYALTRLLRLQLYEVIAPSARRVPLVSRKLSSCVAEAQTLFSIIARCGNREDADARRAYREGMRKLFPLHDREYVVQVRWNTLDRALMELDGLALTAKQQLLDALTLTLSHDRRVMLAEAELLRVVCASLHCPVLPLAAEPADMSESIEIVNATGKTA